MFQVMSQLLLYNWEIIPYYNDTPLCVLPVDYVL